MSALIQISPVRHHRPEWDHRTTGALRAWRGDPFPNHSVGEIQLGYLCFQRETEPKAMSPTPFHIRRLTRLRATVDHHMRELQRYAQLYATLYSRNPPPRGAAITNDLLRLTIAWDDSSQVAVPMRPTPLAVPQAPRTPKSELREEARRRGVPIPMLWDRFPPTSSEERSLMNRELGRHYSKPTRATRDSGFPAFLREQARAMARLSKSPDLYEKLMANSEWKAKQKAQYDGTLGTSIEDLL